MKIEKTNVMRLLDTQKITYNVYTYPHQEQAVDGEMVASLIGKRPTQVFKTLVARAKNQIYVFMIPVCDSLDLKKAAIAANEKSLEMVGVSELLPLTGYIRGGCSPIGMRYKYSTFIEQKAEALDTIIFSAGKIGYQVELSLEDLGKILPIKITNLTVN
ncbi:MAG: Cys-tRNA(Pro) deacylase [Bacilli bacterium]